MGTQSKSVLTLTVGASGTGNDLVVMASLRLTRRASADRR